MHSILLNQNNPHYIRLLEASTVAYTRAKSWEVIITYFLIFLAVAYPVSYIFLKNDKVKFGLFGCSFLLTILIQVFMDKFKGNTSKGAIYKEEFDVDLFGLPWKTTLRKPDEQQVKKLALAYKGTPIKDWYSTNLSPALPRETAIAILQHSNTDWDIVLRRKYKQALVYSLMGYSIVLLLVLVLRRVDFLTTFLVLFSVLSFYTHFISLIRAHSSVIKKREHISQLLDEMLRSRKTISLLQLRDIQDEIFTTRQESTKVPNFFFNWFKHKMNMASDLYIAEMNALYART